MEATKKATRTTKFRKVAGYRIIIQISIAFFIYPGNKQLEIGILKNNAMYNNIKTKKHLGINLTKDAQGRLKTAKYCREKF